MHDPINNPCQRKVPSSPQASILIVDDDAAVRQIEHEILRRHGYDCMQAANARAARSLLDKQHFDLILCDIQMPGESGLDFTAYVRSVFPETAVVMVTVIDDMDVARRAVELDIYGYLVKPIDGNQVLIGVANALRRRQLELREKASQHDLEQVIKKRTAALQKANTALRRREAELEARTCELEELNSALRVLLRQRDEDRTTIEKNVLASVRAVALPSLQRLRSTGKLNARQVEELGILQDGIDALVSPFAKELSSEYYGLTPAEIQVAALIQQGKTTKEIAAALNVSTNTIMTHRYKIRSKLGLIGSHQNLYTCLNALLNQ